MSAWKPTDEQIEALAQAWTGKRWVTNADKGHAMDVADAFQSIIRAAQAEALRDAARDNVKSWGSGGWLSCADKCGNPGCADDVRVDAAQRVSDWLTKRADRIEAHS